MNYQQEQEIENGFDTNIIQTQTHYQLIESPSANISPKICRICLENDKKNEIISPCNCTGSLKYIHRECLQEWITQRQISRERKVSDEIDVTCEVCKSQYKIWCDCSQIRKNCCDILVSRQMFETLFRVLSLAFMIWLMVFLIKQFPKNVNLSEKISNSILILMVSLLLLVLTFLIIVSDIRELIISFCSTMRIVTDNDI